MASLCIASNQGFLTTQENFKSYVREDYLFWTYRGLCSSISTSCCNSVSNNFGRAHCWPLVNEQTLLGKYRFFKRGSVLHPFSGFLGECGIQQGFVCKKRSNSVLNGLSRDRETHLDKVGNRNMRKRFSLRLRPRLRLLFVRLRRFSVSSILNELGAFMRRNMKRLAISTSVTVVLGLCYLFLSLTASQPSRVVPYSDLVMSLQNGSVSKVLFEEGSRRIYYNMNTNTQNPEKGENLEVTPSSSVIDSANSNVPETVGNNDILSPGQVVEGPNVVRKNFKTRASKPQWQFYTRKIEHDEVFLLSLMRDKGTTYSSAPQSLIMSLRSILVTILSLWIPLTPLMWLLYRQVSAANSPAKKRRPTSKAVIFDDVEGVDAAKVELMEIVLCLRGAINYDKLGAKLPRGVLLIGPPGTGKTLLARSVAGEAGVPFFSVSASEFVELFVGRGAARIRDLFNGARKCAPSIIFIDELDAVGGKRGRSFNDERDQTLNQLLTEMDGFESDMKVVVIAATNRPEALDPALCRPGRFSRKVLVGEPDEEGRRKILAVHFRGVPLEEETSIICNLVASLTDGFVGADLANIVNEAALLAARRGNENVTREDIMEAIERAKYGINTRSTSSISKEIGKLFPWMPSLMGRNYPRQDGLQKPVGYQTLS